MGLNPSKLPPRAAIFFVFVLTILGVWGSPADSYPEFEAALKIINAGHFKSQCESFTDSDSHYSIKLSCIFHVFLLFWLQFIFNFIYSSSTLKMACIIFIFCFLCSARFKQSTDTEAPPGHTVTLSQKRHLKAKGIFTPNNSGFIRFVPVYLHQRRRTAWLRLRCCRLQTAQQISRMLAHSGAGQ